jgi:hypothetical protein
MGGNLLNSLKNAAFFITLFFAVSPVDAGAQNCPAMNKELARLRMEYHRQAASASSRTGSVSFEELAVILDKIVELKDSMRKLNCEIRARPKTFQNAR